MQLLSDEVSVLSTNNSDAFLQVTYFKIFYFYLFFKIKYEKKNKQKLAHIDQRERERQEMEQEASNSNKSEEIILLEKQGRSSQKIRNNGMGNLAQVSQSVGQNMTDISHIGTTPNKVSKFTSKIPLKYEIYSFSFFLDLTPFPNPFKHLAKIVLQNFKPSFRFQKL